MNKHTSPARTLKAGVIAALTACAAFAAPASAAPTMGAVDVTVFKHPDYGCPTHVEVYVSSYATGWPDGDTVAHPVTYQVWRMRTSGAIIKYKPLTGSYKPLTMQNGKQTTELSTFDEGEAVGFTANEGFTNKVKLFVLKPFHYESDWQTFTSNCL